MSEPFWSGILLLFSWIVLTLLLSWVIAGTYPLFRRWFLQYPASLRTSYTLSICVIPSVIALAVLVFYSKAKWSAQFVADHCHDLACNPHHLQMPVSSIQGVTLVNLALGAFIVFTIFIARQLFISRRYLKTIESLSNKSEGKGYNLIETETPLAWCAGYLHPKIYLSRGLLDQLTPQELQIVLAHEVSHASRHDNLRKLILNWCTKLWPSSLAKRIRDDFSADIECACDFSATLVNHQNNKTTTIELLKTYCTDDKCGHNDHQHASRLDQLQKEFDFHIKSSKKLWIYRVRIAGEFALITTVLFLITAYFGHPILEWFSQ